MNRGDMAWWRIIVGGIGGGILPAALIIASAVAYDALGGSAEATQVFMVRAGLVIGVGGGALFTLLLARWAALRTGRRALAHGIIVGCVSAAVDFVIVALLAGSWTLPMLVALIVRFPAGLLGGWLVERRPATVGELATGD